MRGVSFLHQRPHAVGRAAQQHVGRLPARIAASRRLLLCRAQQQTNQLVPVRIRIRYEVSFGEHLRVVGSLPQLGDWDPERAPALKWGDGHEWSVTLELPADAKAEFKCVRVRDGGGAEWEGGANRAVDVAAAAAAAEAGDGDGALELVCEWGRSKSNKSSKSSKSSSNGRSSSNGNDAERRPASPMLSSDDDDAPDLLWYGDEVGFMRSNEHGSKERRGTWDVSHLDAASPEAALVKGDRDAPNWLGKLGVAKALLVDGAPRLRPTADALAAGFVYLQWVASGAVGCVEGGGHYRPNHHAKLGQAVFKSLEWAIADESPPGPVTLLARRVHTRIPSFGEAFTQTVPLTRIRDIAHRGDIPHDLKQEIKHTLQNKLHRNAGPEDLVATELMLRRVTANPGEFSGAFVEEFKIFAVELRDFFNAGNLGSVLDALRPSLDDADAATLEFFVQQKRALDAAGAGAGQNELVAAMHALTTLRAMLAGQLSSGLRGDVPDAAVAARQRWRLAELRCEDYFFVLLSRFVNAVEGAGGAAALATASDLAWSHPVGAAVLALRNVGISGWRPAECMALDRELSAWHAAGALTAQRDAALRLKASLERAARLSEAYADALLELLPGPASALGAALGVPRHAVETFTESEVRSSVVFQLSKLLAVLAKAARAAADCPPWQPLVVGVARGRLVEAATLDPAALAGAPEPAVLLLRRADGDEEVSAAGPALAGVVLTHDLPHLSHLGVRARQERVPFATLDDAALLGADVAPLVGKLVELDVRHDGVTLREITAQEVKAAANAAKLAGANDAVVPVAVPAPVVRDGKKLLALSECDAARGGAKSAGCAALDAVAHRSAGTPAEFSTPRGAVVPFGAMDAALNAVSGKRAEFDKLLAATENAPVGPELDAACDALQALVSALPLPPGLPADVAAAFPSSSSSSSSPLLIIARSSANVEDLAGMSGAGLYDSIPNVDPTNAECVRAAVAAVWASLYTRRAVLSRRAAGVAQRDAAMAVLLQELLAPSTSFVLHTLDPLSEAGTDVAVAELAAGLGETLASGTRGSAWRLAVDKKSGATSVRAFANFSEAMLPAGGGAAVVGDGALRGTAGGSLYASSAASLDGGSSNSNTTSAPPACRTVTLDYSRQELSTSADTRDALGARLGALSALLEAEFGGAPQDAEGCVVGGRLHVVQTRPQPQ